MWSMSWASSLPEAPFPGARASRPPWPEAVKWTTRRRSAGMAAVLEMDMPEVRDERAF